MTMDPGTSPLDRKSGESDDEYNARIERQAAESGQSVEEYRETERAAAGRPETTEPDQQG